MSSPIDLDQQRKSAEFRRRANRGQDWFFGLFMVYILVLGLWMFVARPAFAESPDPAIQRLVGLADMAGVFVMFGFILVIVFLMATGRLRLLLGPDDQITYVMPADRDAVITTSSQQPSQRVLLLSYVLMYGGIIIGTILIFALQQFVERTWPQLPLWIARGGIVVPVVILVVILYLMRDWLIFGRSMTPDQLRNLFKVRLSRFVPLIFLALASIVMVLLASEGRLPVDLIEILRAAAQWVERNLFFALVGLIVIGAVLYFAVLWLVEAQLKQGKYDKALRLMDLFGFLINPAEARLFFRGSILLFAGRNADAEKLLDESVQRGTTPEHTAFALENRGYARMHQGKYDLAQQDFEQAIQVRPEGHGAYSGLAETLLHQNKDTRRAVELAEHALANMEQLASARRFSSERRAEYWSVKAWALALTGIRNDAERALEKAFEVAVRDYKPVLALVYCRAGRVYVQLGNNAKSKEMFQQALALDPEGYAGQLASRMLSGDFQAAG